MFRKTFLFCILIVLLYLPKIYPQYNNQSSNGIAPWSPQTYFANAINPYSTGFAYAIVGTQNANSQLFKFHIGDPATKTEIGTAPLAQLGNGDFANPEGVWKFYVQETYESPFNIFEVDTATGVLTNLGAPSNLKTGHRPKVMEWDQTTNKWYIISQNNGLTELQVYLMDWETKELTWIGPTVTTAPLNIQAGGFNVNGTFFGVDLITLKLWKLNKYTGAWTAVGPMGLYFNNAMDGCFDRSNYSRLLWVTWGIPYGSLYQIDTASGNATFVGDVRYGYLIYGMGAAPYWGPQIGHTPLESTGNLTGPYIVNASAVSTNSGIASMKTYWSRNNTTLTDSIAMTNTGGNNWTAGIPGNGLGATYRYTIKAADSLGRTTLMPYNAPANVYSFNAMAQDTTRPVITHTPIANTDIMLWPVTVGATVTDNNGIDSVWVRWKINSGFERTFRMSNTSGSSFSSLFNSTYSDVTAGDTIKYRIVAQDNSISHVKDSTALNYFRITSTGTYTCIGTGNSYIGLSSPFHNFWPGFKTQMLWTASEINANGGAGSGNITRIAFYVIRPDTTMLRHFTLKFANSSLTSLTSGFVNAYGTTVFSANVKIQNIGWNYFDLITPFYWDGVSSLLIETCFNNFNFVNNGGSYVQGTPAPGMMYYGYRSDSLICSGSSPDGVEGSNARPNICYIIDHNVGTGNNQNGVPSVFSLHQNYPNPFNPSTRITYDVPATSFVTLKIYNILGCEIKTLVNEMKRPGLYSVDFDASGLPSGIYFYLLESGGFRATRKMALLK